GVDAGAIGQLAHQHRQRHGGRFADIENAEVRVLSLGQLRENAGRDGLEFAFGKSGGKRRAHDGPPISRARTGAMRSTSAAMPRSFGCSPSGWLSCGSIATPSRKNG